MKTSKLKYLKILQDSYKRGKISKKEWKSERKLSRQNMKSSIN